MSNTPLTHLDGIPIVVNPLAMDRKPARLHRKRKQRHVTNYHSRVQKKWTKRWCVVSTPGCWCIAYPCGAIGSQVLVMHPDVFKKLKGLSA